MMNNIDKSFKESQDSSTQSQQPSTTTKSSMKELQSFLVQAAKNKLLNFCQVINNEYVAAWFHERIASLLEKALEDVVNKKKVRIILSIPPRHGKSVLASNFFPAWALGKYPNLKFILSTYGAELSEKMGMQTRDIISSEKYQAIFPEVKLRPDVKSKAKWMTNKDGSYTAVGIGGAVTGIGANVIIIDDPHKSRDEAESETVRETVWDYYRSTLYSRLEGYGAIIIIMQRWRNDDLVGRVIEHSQEMKEAGEAFDEWTVINFPAIAEEDEYLDGELIRKQGDPLWKDKYPLEVLDNIRTNSGVYNWASQFQQSPISSETQVFRSEYFKYYEEKELIGKYLKYYTFVDPAISDRDSGDNCVITTIAKEISAPNIYRIQEDAGHYSPQKTIEIIFKHAQEYKSDVWLETVAYQKALKYSIEEEQRKREIYFALRETSNSNKEVRIEGLLPLYERGVIFHKRSDVEYEKEALQFPKGRRDDRLDAMSFCLEAMDQTKTRRFAKVYYPHLKR